MATYVVTIDTGNAAFEDENEGHEVARILEGLAMQCRASDEAIQTRLYDYNGNTVGRAARRGA